MRYARLRGNVLPEWTDRDIYNIGRKSHKIIEKFFHECIIINNEFINGGIRKRWG